MMTKKPKNKKRLLTILWLVLALPFAVLAAFYAWTAFEPRNLQNFLPQIEASIEGELQGYDVEISEAYLHWAGAGELLNIQLKKVDVLNIEKNKIAYIPQLELNFKILPLLIGELVPANISVSNIDISYGGEQIDIEHFEADFDNEFAEFKANLRYDDKPLDVYGSAEIGASPNKVKIFADKVNLQNFQNLIPELAAANLSLDINAEFLFENHKISKISLLGKGINGVVENEKFLRDKLEIADGKFAGSYDFDAEKFALAEFNLAFVDEAKIFASGSGSSLEEFDAVANVENMQILNLKNYWPQGVSDNAIAWINESIIAGKISSAEAKISMRPWYLEAEQFPADAVAVSMNFEGFEVNYGQDMPPVTNGSGVAIMDATSLTVNVLDADISGSKISDTVVKILGIGVLPIEELEMSGKVVGSPSTLIAFYEKAHPKDAIIRAKDVTDGAATTNAELKFPLDKDLLLKDISIVLNSEVINASAKNADFAVTNLNAKIAMDDKGYKLTGAGDIAPKLNMESFVADIIPIKFDVSDAANIEQYIVSADLKNAKIVVKDLGIEKKKGAAANVQITARKKGKFADIQNFKFTSNALKFEGDGDLENDLSGFKSLNFYGISFGKSNLQGKVVRDYDRKKAGYKIYMKGDYFNAEPLLETADDAIKDKDAPPVYMELKLDKLAFAADKSLKDVAITLYCFDGNCEKVEAKSDLLTINKNADKLQIDAIDAGEVLTAFDVYDQLDGGKLVIKADVVDGRYVGTLLITDFKIKQSRFLTGLLTLGSLTGIADTLKGGGISFEKANVSFDYESDVAVKIKEARIKGNSLGGTIEGNVNLINDKLDLQGKIIPAYSANTLLGEIPLLGDLLIGDDGIFALAYTVKGTVDDPEQMVNPLSVLAPGFLQKVFE